MKWAAALLLTTAISATTTAKAATIYGLTADRQVASDGGLGNGSTMMAGYSGTAGYNGVVVFQLPTLPAGEEFGPASFSLYLQGKTGTPTFNGDLYGLASDSSSDVLASDFFIGSSDSTAALIKDNFLVPANGSGRVSGSSAALTWYLNNAYDNGAGAGKYIFFRVNPDIAGLNQYIRYNMYSADYTGGSYYWPSLTYSTAATGWKTVPLGGGGYVTGLVSDSTGNDIYCRTDVGGAFHWDSVNSKWNSITDTMVPVTTAGACALHGISAIAVDPSDSNNIYIAADQKIYSSGDKGETWTCISSSTSITMYPNGTYRSLGERLAVDPNDSNTLWFGSSKAGLHKGVLSGTTWSWTQIPSTSVPFGQVSGTNVENAGVTFVACDKNGTSTIVYAGVYDSVGTTGGVYQCSDGINWSKVSGATLRTPLRGQVATSNGTLCVTSGTYGAGLMQRSGTLALLSTLPTGISYKGVAMSANADIIFIAEGANTTWGNIWRSGNGGANWTRQASTLANTTRGEPDGTPCVTGYWFGNIASLLLDPANPNELWASDFFGVACTPDAQNLGVTGTASYWYMLQKGQEETCIASLKNAPTGAALMAGVGDVGGFRYLDTTVRPTGAGGAAFRNPAGGNDTSLDFCESNNNVWARSWVNSGGNGGSGAVSIDGGVSWIAFGGIAVKTCTNSSTAGTESWDLSTYLSQQRAKGVQTVTLVLAAYKGDSSGNYMPFDSKEATDSTTWPQLVLDGTTTLTPIADTFDNSAATTTNYGNSTSLSLGYAYSSANRRIYLRFDLSSVTSITSATLNMHRRSATNTLWFTVGVYACTNTTWIEGNGGTDNLPVGELTWANKPATLASNTDPIVSPNYYAGASQIRGGRLAVSATNPNLFVWLAEGTANGPRYSTDRGVTWTLSSGGPKSQVINLYNPGVILQQLTSDRVNGKFYAARYSTGSGNNTIYCSTDGGATFVVSGTVVGGSYNVYRSQIVAAPAADDVWVCDDGVSTITNGGLWHSTDGGKTWPKLSGLTAVSQVTFGAPKPGSGQPYSVFINGYKAGARGIYRSDDKGATWVKLADVPTISEIRVLAGDRQNYGTVFFGTGGRGIFQGH